MAIGDKSIDDVVNDSPLDWLDLPKENIVKIRQAMWSAYDLGVRKGIEKSDTSDVVGTLIHIVTEISLLNVNSDKPTHGDRLTQYVAALDPATPEMMETINMMAGNMESIDEGALKLVIGDIYGLGFQVGNSMRNFPSQMAYEQWAKNKPEGQLNDYMEQFEEMLRAILDVWGFGDLFFRDNGAKNQPVTGKWTNSTQLSGAMVGTGTPYTKNFVTVP